MGPRLFKKGLSPFFKIILMRPTTELDVSLNVNHEEHVLRALADASSSIILEASSSKDLIKHNKDNKINWTTMGGQFTTEKDGLVCFLLPELTSRNKFLRSFTLMTNSRHQTLME
jgi:hypothetical protein